ncbi:MAG: hypothetical protein BWY10_00368 [Chloroflexi bacterium ADurb.Bin180]|nr:MAG: hypothetical protein BWY10_00368 [Chloroflexi bacterium ADurb.Bin180]
MGSHEVRAGCCKGSQSIETNALRVYQARSDAVKRSQQVSDVAAVEGQPAEPVAFEHVQG